LSVRATRDESEIEGLVAGVRTESERIDTKCHSADGVSGNEAIERPERLKEDTLGLPAALALRIPRTSTPEPGQAPLRANGYDRDLNRCFIPVVRCR
jgi:hypothetical protein